MIYAAGVLPNVHASFEVAALFLQAPQPKGPVLRMFRVPGRGDEEAVEKDFEKLLRMQGGRGENGYVVRVPIPAQDALQFDRHDPTLLAKRKDLAGYGSVVTVGELFTRGPSVPLQTLTQRTGLSGQAGAVRILRGRDVLLDGTIASPDPDGDVWTQLPRESLLQVGDLILRSISRPTDRRLVVSEVRSEHLPAAVDERVMVLRPKAPLDAQQIRFILLFLRSPMARALLVQAGVHVLWRDLADLPLPQPDEALASALDDLDIARQRLEEWHGEADEILQSVFIEQSAAQARDRIVQSGQTLRLRIAAADLLDDLGHIVRTRFPYPIALRWRETEAALSTRGAGAAYEAILGTAEILLAYSALIAAALAKEEGVRLESINSIREQLARGRGPGFGDWVATLEEISGKRVRRGLPAEHPLNALGSLFSDEQVKAARRRLSDRRNDQSHERRVDPIDLPQAQADAFADLTTLIEGARFLADWSLIHVTGVHWDAFRGHALVDYRNLMGDHPAVPTNTMSWNSSDIELGSLYLKDRENRLHLLRPFLIGHRCRECRSWSTFHVDKAPQGTVTLKSLEHGHPLDYPIAADPLRHVGLL
ncbi:restriction endonuclease [Streptomyces katrae]|uniref:Restriction endonuclease n=1 Tax=Streptomyces katrae TaxID=68223 RepID=A0ABT7GUB9_9ACTN|nr:restriction endonuclease [Streptomyces katrae]MDK9497053.1 restriction endonuclease [Streptomyces katrae]